MFAPRFNSRTVVATVSSFLVLATMPVGSVSAQEPTFKDVTAEMGLKISTDAACWVDLDNDGWVDLCVSGGVWKNNAGKTFTRVADVLDDGLELNNGHFKVPLSPGLGVSVDMKIVEQYRVG